MTVERFELEPFTKWTFLASPWIFGALALLGVALPFLPDDGRPTNPTVLWMLSVACTAGFGAAAWFSVTIVRRIPSYPIEVNSDGLWPAHRPRAEALVCWNAIASVRERPYLQCLELFDAEGARLIRLEYQLLNFERLRNLIRERAALRLVAAPSRVFEKRWWHHVFGIFSILGFVALGLYVAQEQPLLGYIGAAAFGAMLGWEYWNTAYRVAVFPGKLTISWPGRSMTLRPQEVGGVELSDSFVYHARHPRVSVLVLPRRTMQLQDLGVSAFELQRTLAAWKRDVA